MAEPQRTMFDYARLDMPGTKSSIVRLAVTANNFEIKPNIIQMVQQFVQFDGLQDEDPNAHLANFMEICAIFKINEATYDAIRLRLFPFSLRVRAKQWLSSQPKASIDTWNLLAEKFLAKYFHLPRLQNLEMTSPPIPKYHRVSLNPVGNRRRCHF